MIINSSQSAQQSAQLKSILSMQSMHSFKYNGMNSNDYGLRISGEDTWTRPQPDVQRIQIPGRNGDLVQLRNRYENLDITYHCGIIKNLQNNFDAFNAALLANPGYHRLEDSYHLDYYRIFWKGPQKRIKREKRISGQERIALQMLGQNPTGIMKPTFITCSKMSVMSAIWEHRAIIIRR